MRMKGLKISYTLGDAAKYKTQCTKELIMAEGIVRPTPHLPCP